MTLPIFRKFRRHDAGTFRSPFRIGMRNALEPIRKPLAALALAAVFDGFRIGSKQWTYKYMRKKFSGVPNFFGRERMVSLAFQMHGFRHGQNGVEILQSREAFAPKPPRFFASQ